MKRTKTAGRLLCGIWLLGILCVLLSGCSTEKVESITSIRQLDGKTIGVMTGSTFDKHTDTYIHDAKKNRYLQAQGFQMMRFSSIEIFQNIDACIKEIDEQFWRIQRGCIWPSCPASGAIIPGQSGP